MLVHLPMEVLKGSSLTKSVNGLLRIPSLHPHITYLLLYLPGYLNLGDLDDEVKNAHLRKRRLYKYVGAPFKFV